MNKTQLIDELSSRFQGNKKVAADALEAVVDTITRTVAKGEKVAITGFGVFEKIDKPARFARNPATGERVRVKKTSVPRFKAGTGFKDVVSGAKKLPKLTVTRAGSAATKATGAGRATSGPARERVTAAGRGSAAKASPAKSAGATKTASTNGAAAKKTSPARSAAKKASPAKKA
jgi:DNA-binding protein HU-beta